MKTYPPVLELKSAQFRRDRETAWAELATLVERAERRGIKSLDEAQLMRLPMLYRTALSSLSVARSISLDRALLDYLEALAARAYFQIYGPRSGFFEVARRFFRRDFPAAIRRLGFPLLLAAIALIGGACLGYWLALGDSDWFYTLVSPEPSDVRTPAADTETLRQAIYDTDIPDGNLLTLFASFLFTHNAKIGILAFVLGFGFALPSILLLAWNGLTLGAFIALHVERGLGFDIVAWLAIHGTTELFAVILCGAGGIALGQALVFPGESGRLDNLARQGRLAGQVILGAIIMFFLAGLLEGLGRQLILDPYWRLSIGSLMLVFWCGYFFLSSGAREVDLGKRG